MTDIFISYSKSDREKVVLLASYLEAEGWSVWWDTNLSAGDAYRDEIMRQLVAARAVIVLWTQASIKSDFVRAEAGRAKAEGKLIPVKAANVSYGDIPLPFGEMHTEDLTHRYLIRAAIAAELTKPRAQPSELRIASATLKYQFLTWIGIIGGALTLFTNLQSVLVLARWAEALAALWREWTASIYQVAFGYLGFAFNKAYAPPVSITLFGIMLAIGARRSRPVQASLGERRLGVLASMLAFAIFVIVASIGVASPNSDHIILKFLAQNWTVIGVLLPIGLLCYTYRDQLITVAVFCTLCGGAYHLMFYRPTFILYPIWFPAIVMDYPWVMNYFVRAYAFAPTFLQMFGAIYFLPSVMLMICPLKQLTNRFIFVSIGFLILMALNQVSIYAPAIRGVLSAH